jgi:LAO/AO transport system kinase
MVHEKAKDGVEIPVIKTIASQNTGIDDLAEAIETFLKDYNRITEKQLYMLTEKSWQIIQRLRMKDIDRNVLKTSISNAVQNNDFNLYSFIQSYLDNKNK